jgi:6-phosphogluconolactonase (cycloisomerase 2 family)
VSGGGVSVLGEVGGRGEIEGLFDFPTHVVFLPNGNLLICEWSSRNRVQEIKRNGSWVRSFVMDCICIGIDVNSDVIVAAQAGSHDKIHIYDCASGEPLMKFGRIGPEDGQLDGPHALCISQNGRYVVVAEADNHRVSWFELPCDGCWDRAPTIRVLRSDDGLPIAFNRPMDVCFLDNHLIAVANTGDDEIVVLSVDFEKREFAVKLRVGQCDGIRFKTPKALAWIQSSRQLLVLSQHSSRVSVLNMA